MATENISNYEKVRKIANSDNFANVAAFVSDESDVVRLALAIQYSGEENFSDVLRALVEDKAVCVRMAMVSNEKLPKTLIERLKFDKNATIAQIARDRLNYFCVA